jgi:hypothetical protein
MDALKSDPLSLLYILTSAMGVGIFRGALKAEAQIEGFNSYELVRFNLTVARGQLLETAQELQADYKVESL